MIGPIYSRERLLLVLPDKPCSVSNGYDSCESNPNVVHHILQLRRRPARTRRFAAPGHNGPGGSLPPSVAPPSFIPRVNVNELDSDVPDEEMSDDAVAMDREEERSCQR